ncbi:MAG: hypothetical protein RMJ87_06625 [Cytophagales bacterium]|nr:hypothetical protein [Bernardetiaceae bacterium]MDW8204686.1 hypothetical protein [Cytophagales bacterium]
MNTPFADLPETARVWLYAANRAFTAQEETIVCQLLQKFVAAWNSHGKSLVARAEVLHHQIIAFAVDTAKTPPSGCAIDKSVALLRHLENQLDVTLLDGGRVFYQSGEQLVALPLMQVKTAIAKNVICANTLVLNTQAASVKEVREKLFIHAAHSWMARYFAATHHAQG